jgi:amino acid permease
VSARTLVQLAHHTWFPAVLGQLQNTGIHIVPFFIPLLRSTLSAIQSQTDDRKDLCNFAEQLLDVVDENLAQLTVQ